MTRHLICNVQQNYIVYTSWSINKFFLKGNGRLLRPGVILVLVTNHLPFFHVFHSWSWERGYNGFERQTRINYTEILPSKWYHLFGNKENTTNIDLINPSSDEASSSYDFFLEFSKLNIPRGDEE